MRFYGESEKHQQAKERFRQILRGQGLEVDNGERTGTVGAAPEKGLVPHPYVYDVYGEGLFLIASEPHQHELKVFVRIVGEVDGKVGHKKSLDNTKKDTKRTKRIEEYERGKPYVVRVDTNDLIGRKKLTDEQLWEDIQYSLLNKLKLRHEALKHTVASP